MARAPLINGSHKLDVREDATEAVSKGVTIQIAGISVGPVESLEKKLYVTLKLDGIKYPKLPFTDTSGASITTEPLRCALNPFLTLREGSKLTIRLRKKRRLLKDVALAKVAIPFDKIRSFLDSVTPDHFIIYQIHTDPQMWLDIAAGPYALQTSLNVAVQKSKEHQSVLDHLGEAKDFLDTLLKFSVALSGLDAGAKVVMGCVTVVYEKLQSQDKCDKGILDLAERMARTLRYIEDVDQFAHLAQLKKSMEEVYPLMAETQNFILLWGNRSGMENFLKSHSIQETFDNLNKRFDVFQQQFDRGIAIDSGVKIDALRKIQDAVNDDKLLKQLRPKGIETSPLMGECMQGTRENIFSDISSWLNDFESHNILWIRGFPGVGKSTLASSIVSRLFAQHRLGSYFAFDRARVSVATPNALWRCVGYDLARQYPSARQCIVERLQDEEVEVNSSNIKTLFRTLVEEPLEESEDIPRGRLPVFIIDALDECGGLHGRQSDDREELLETLERWPRLSKKFKLIVTSRQEDDIFQILSPVCVTVDLSSGTSVSSQSSDDIRTFFTRRFRKIAEGYPDSLPADWPGTTVIDELTIRAAGLFVWATTVVEFINSGEPQTQLKEIMDHNLEMGDMALLYSRILQTSFRLPSPEVLDAFDVLVGAMILARRPLRRTECIDLLGIKPSMLDFIRKGLRSVIDPGNTLRFTHQSFVDFLLNPDKCPPPFFIDVQKQHRLLAEACLRTMSAKLCFNICDLETSTLKDADVPDIDLKVKNGIPSHLSYSCRYWADHLSSVLYGEDLMLMVKQMIYDQFLYWLEVMSLLNELNVVKPILTSVLEWSEPENDETFRDFMNDALRFVAAFGYAISQSTPHIYLSALPFSPKQSQIAQRFLPKYTRTIIVATGKPTYWPSILFVSEEHTEAVNTVAFSPDQDYFVSGSSDKTICICDAETGNLVSGPFEGHESSIASVAFSPDGQKIVSGSDDLTVRVWDAESGDELLCLTGHDNVVTCVVYSHDGRRIASASYDGTIRIWDPETGGTLGSPLQGHESGITVIAFSADDQRIVSGSIDRTVRVWDTISGECVSGPFTGHQSRVNAVAFSPDGQCVASGSEDETIHVWDMKTGELAIGPLDGHTDAVTSLAYSADGKLLVSGSHDETVRVWDPSTGEMIFGPLSGHTNGITTVAVSVDGKRIVSGSRDETVRMWDLDAKEASPSDDLADAHSDGVTCVAFSPCGKMLVSGSDDDTIRVWDAITGKPLLEPIRGHKSWISTVAFSPDGEWIASGSDDQSIRIWNVKTGELVCPPLNEHGSGVTYLSFLPSGQRLVSGSYDQSVRMWDIEMAKDILGPIVHHSSWVTCIAISPDGTKAISSSHDKTIKMWSTETGQILPVRFQEHPGAVTCVAFSPSGKLICSGSLDRSAESMDGIIRVWDAGTGELVAGPFRGHTQLIYSVAFSPDEHYIASGSGDRTIRIWDVGTRGLLFGPLYGHAGGIVGVVFSPDGKKMVSCSEDETIRIWDTSDFATLSLDHSLEERCYPGGGYTDKCVLQNGWVTKTNGELLFWVPPWNRNGLWWPRNIAVIAGTPSKLDLTRFEYGTSWQRCKA